MESSRKCIFREYHVADGFSHIRSSSPSQSQRHWQAESYGLATQIPTRRHFSQLTLSCLLQSHPLPNPIQSRLATNMRIPRALQSSIEPPQGIIASASTHFSATTIAAPSTAASSSPPLHYRNPASKHPNTPIP